MYNKTFDIDEFIVHRPDLSGTDSTQSRLIGSTSNTVIYSVNDDLILINDAGSTISNIATTAGQPYYRNNYSSKILSGGILYYESLFEKISFAKFKQYLNDLDPFIEYESYDSSGLLATGNWFAEIPNVSTIIKTTKVLTVEDSNRPSSIAFNQKVGYTHEEEKLNIPYKLNRYGGGVSPLFKNLFTFNSKFNFVKNVDIASLDLSNTLTELIS